MTHRVRLRKNEDGQGLIVVIAVVAISAILMVALEVSVIGDSQLSASSTSQEQALQAADSGLANYQTWVNGSLNQWEYAMNYCSAGAFSCPSQTNATAPPCPPPNASQACPDPNNPAFSGEPDDGQVIKDGGCTGSPYNASNSSPGNPTYFGWVTIHGSTTGGFAEQYQYVVDSSLAKELGGYVHVFVTGRAGYSSKNAAGVLVGHYVCSTVKALYNGPQLTPVNTQILAPATCTATPQEVLAPSAAGSNLQEVKIEAIGGAGAQGGSELLSAGGGTGGVGETVEATYAATSSTTLWVTIGCQGGTDVTQTIGGSGFSSGGSLPQSPKPKSNGAGGAGGATAVCSIQNCTSSGITGANLGNDLYMVAGGGGGGGEGLIGAQAAGGTGGDGVQTSVTLGALTLGIAEDGSTGSKATPWVGGGGGAGGVGGKASTGYSPAGQAGNQGSGYKADGGAGGGGYSGGSGGQVGNGGGGGGAGASFYNTNSAPSGGGSIGKNLTAPLTGFKGVTSAITASSIYGQVVITWEDGSGNPIGTPVVPPVCTTSRTTTIPALTTVSLEASGASGGNGDNLQYFGLFSNGAGTQGLGAQVFATFANTSILPVDVTSIQGCEGAIGGDNGITPGGEGYGGSSPPPPNSGGANCSTCGSGQGDSGSGGGASAICLGDTCSTTSAANLLVVAGGGAGGGGVDGIIGLCTGGNGGNGGANTASLLPSPNSNPEFLIGGNGTSVQCLQSNNSVGVGGQSAASPSPVGGSGNQASNSCGGDGGGGGGGYTGGTGGGAGSGLYLGFCLLDYAGSAGGGGGSSYLATTTGSLQLQTCAPSTTGAPVYCLYGVCPPPGGSNPTLSTSNSGSGPVYERKWCNTQPNTNGEVSVTETAIPNSSVLLSQSPAPIETTTW